MGEMKYPPEGMRQNTDMERDKAAGRATVTQIDSFTHLANTEITEE